MLAHLEVIPILETIVVMVATYRLGVEGETHGMERTRLILGLRRHPLDGVLLGAVVRWRPGVLAAGIL